jgi:glycosyltransferase involved in cell wall biosynthesis/tetratricopeptide (TPR) repeat protein
MTDADVLQCNNLSMPEMLFILSTGRSGTKTIADYLSTLNGCDCLHEPEPRLILESSNFRYGRLNQNELVGTLRRRRPLECLNSIYGESNQTLSLIIPALNEAFPKARYIWLIRNGLDVVASAVGRNWYTDRSMDGKTYNQCSRIEQEWIDGRVQGHLCGDVSKAEWELMSPFEKCCWYWGYINRLIEKDLQSLISPSARLLVKLEELEISAGSIARWIGLDAEENLLVPHQNRAHYPVFSPKWWSDSQWKSFDRWCGSLMDQLYPSWRQINQYQRLTAEAEALIESGGLKAAEELLQLVSASNAMDARGHNSFGVLFLKKGDLQKAKQSYETAVALDPDNVCYLLNLADLIFVGEQQAEAAWELYSQVLRREPSNLQALMNKLIACLSLGRTHQAQEIENILQTLSHDRPEVAQWLQQLRDNRSTNSKTIDSATPEPTPDLTVTSPTSFEARTEFATQPIAQVNGCASSGSTIAPPTHRAPPTHSPQDGRSDSDLDSLNSRLEQIGWSSKFERYREIFSWVHKMQVIDKPKVSIIVISWRLHPDTLKSFEILSRQRNQGYELIFVDNGSPKGSFKKLENFIDTYVRLNTNTGAYLARNLGAVFADAPILFFLEDDGLPYDDIVSAHLRTHHRYDVISVRGVCLPKTPNNRINSLAKHYYLGSRPFPWHVNLEGNASYRADAFFSVGGWDDDNRFGGGGPELSCRLLEHEPDWCKQIYSPEPVILHDYAADHEHLQKKTTKQREQVRRIKEKSPGFEEFLKKWQQFYLRTDLLKIKESLPSHSDSTADSSAADLFAARQLPLISVVIPTHNRCRFLKQAIESALCQTADDYEVIVVDDGSIDGTQSLIQGFSCDRLYYLKKQQTGAPDTRNCGIDMARGEYILWLDDDDVLSADTIATHSEVVARHPEADIIYGVLQEFDDQTGKPLRLYDPKDWSMHGDMLLSSLVVGCCVPNPGTMVRRSCYERVGRYEKGFIRAHDYEFWTRAAGHFKFQKNYNIVCRYRVHTTNISAGTIKDQSYESRIIRRMVAHYGLKKIYHWFDWSNPEAAEVAALYTVASNLFRIGDVHHSALFLKQIPIHLWNADIAELGLTCMLFQGRWKNHGDLLEQVKKRNILAPQKVKLLRQKADQHWRSINGLRRVLNKKNRQKVDAYLKTITEDNDFPLPPDCAVKMGTHLLNFTNDRHVSFSSSMSFKLLQRAVMADPSDQTICQEIRKLPISDADRDIIDSIRKRMLTDWDCIKNNSSSADWAPRIESELSKAAIA